MKNKILIGVAVIAALFVAMLIVKKVSPVSWGMWGTYNASSGLALKGHDPVAYFVDAKATMGNEDHTYVWMDATWQFASAENLARFATDPNAFAAQFGGFCSYAVSKGFTADIDPDAWHIHDDKLYVFADQNVLDEWVADLENGSLDRSARHWAKR